jgi:hypothetical protein
MSSKRLPYLFLLAGALIMFVYPRLLPADTPAILRTDGIVGFAHGIAIGLELLALMLLRRGNRGVSCSGNA